MLLSHSFANTRILQNYEIIFIPFLYLLLLSPQNSAAKFFAAGMNGQNMASQSNIDKVWYAVVNPNAGSGKTVAEWPKAETVLKERRIGYEYRTTWQCGAAIEITVKACEAGYRRFLAVGGDGTVHEVLEGIVRFIEMSSSVAATFDDGALLPSLSDFTLAVIPVGSGNDWIRTLGVPKDPAEIARLLKSEHFGKQDVFRIKGRDSETSTDVVSYMANIGGIGFDANVCHRVNFEKNSGKSGKILYLKVLISNVLHCKPFRCRVIADGRKVFEGDTLSIAMGVGKYSGGGMMQVPDAVMDDGLLDVTIIPVLPILKIIRAVPTLFSGNLLSANPELTFTRCSSLIVEPIDGLGALVEVDGEVIGNAPISVDRLPGQLNVLVGE